MSEVLLSEEVLRAQNAETSSAIISFFQGDATFEALSKFEGDLIYNRDMEDDTKLAAGIKIGVDRGSIPADPNNQPYMVIDVLGKSPQDVVDIILNDVGAGSDEGAVIVLCGLSGTGKGTTAALLASILPKCITWSNGNLFRSITLLAVTWCEQQGMDEFDATRALTDDNIREFMGMLSFEKIGTEWEVVINGLGLNTHVSAIQNTELKSPKVAKNIPTVAQQTQGEVINFATGCLEKVRADGHNVLLEGREQTVNYVPTPFRYTLTISDPELVGRRRAAQRIGASTLTEFTKRLVASVGPEGDVSASLRTSQDVLVTITLKEQLQILAREAGVVS